MASQSHRSRTRLRPRDGRIERSSSKIFRKWMRAPDSSTWYKLSLFQVYTATLPPLHQLALVMHDGILIWTQRNSVELECP
ncbi:hypothetical protein Y032_0140g2158 [Ancylostoma ceylanicum]|uniref:Uncharacterized protein n=1 Tax=Ancylostoma ceylanicum TaxID=53326 RepID=A0A016T4A9_9BILA|nr:hypothetical protein Y032_0140g2158 [Ancylostoma ceylanicum]